jgi:two-component system sensor histidine kinase/response regulator
MSRIYDYAGSLRRMGDDHELFHEMAGLLKADAPDLLRTIRSAFDQGDLSQVQRGAHTLKGLASNFGAEQAVAAAAELERLAKQRQSPATPQAIDALERTIEELISALAPMFAASPS